MLQFNANTSPSRDFTLLVEDGRTSIPTYARQIASLFVEFLDTDQLLEQVVGLLVPHLHHRTSR